MRYALFSDIHGDVSALESVLDDARTRQIDRYLCLGDLCNDQSIEAVRRLGAETAFGNWEVMLTALGTLSPENQAWLFDLPPLLKFETFWAGHADPIWEPTITNLRSHWQTKDIDAFTSDFPDHKTNSAALRQVFTALQQANISIFFYGHIHQQRVWQCSPSGDIEERATHSFTLQPDHWYMVSIDNVSDFMPGTPPTYTIFDTSTRQVELLQI